MIDESVNQTNRAIFLQDNVESSKKSKTHNLAGVLVKIYREVVPRSLKRSTGGQLIGRDIPGHDLTQHDIWLADAHQHFHDISQKQIALSHTSEWTLDNYYIIRYLFSISQVDQVCWIGFPWFSLVFLN
ncbi:MAG: hypothetical protein FP831_19635 [Anaerolineae bacterium]|nr:hypothetical protein [Anaerolineae bacterium]